MKILFDTNILIAAFIARGQCGELLDHCLIEYSVYTSNWIIRELREKLSKKFGFSKKDVARVETFIKNNFITITHGSLPFPVCSDPDDDNILAAAVSGVMNCIITGDKDLLTLKKIKKIPILKHVAFWKFEKEYFSVLHI